MKTIKKILLIFIILLFIHNNSQAIQIYGEGQVIPKSNLYKCQNGLKKIIRAGNFIFGANGAYKILKTNYGICARIGDGICRDYENEITSPIDCKGKFRIISVKPEGTNMVIKYFYKNISNNNKKIIFQYHKKNSYNKTDVINNNGQIILGINAQYKLEDGGQYLFKIYDYTTNKELGHGGFTFDLHKKEGETIKYGTNGKCFNGLVAVPKKEYYDNYGNLISNKYDKICIKKDDGFCDTRYENQFNSPNDCNNNNNNNNNNYNNYCDYIVTQPQVDSNCYTKPIKNIDGCIIDYEVICQNEKITNYSNQIFDINNCNNENFPVCGEKNGVKQTYKNLCFAIKDSAKIINTGKCIIKLRDDKGCLIEKYNWCSTLKRCLKKTKNCPNNEYIPSISNDFKLQIKKLLNTFYDKLKNHFNKTEDILKTIDKTSEKIDLLILEKPNYKDLLYFIIQEIEQKRTYFLNK